MFKLPCLERFHSRIAEKAHDIASAPVLIVALGDSVAQGAAGLNEILHEGVYHAQLKRLLQQRYPQSIFSVINAGVGGETALGGLRRLDRDVLRHQPDLVLIAFGLNDAAAGAEEGLEHYAETMRDMIGRIRKDSDADIILVTPNMMASRDNDAVPECYRHLTEAFLYFQNTGILAAYAQKLREVGQADNVPVADIYAAWAGLAASGVDTTAMLANGLNHPNVEGHRLAADVIMQVIESARMAIDAADQDNEPNAQASSAG